MQISRIFCCFRPVFFLALCCCLTGLSCAKEEGLKIDVDGANVCEEIAKVACHNIFQCCTGQEIEDFFGIAISTSEQKCRDDMELMCSEINRKALYGISRGSVRIEDLPASTECLESLLTNEGGCFYTSTELPFADACEDFRFEGTLDAGTSCDYNIECRPDSYCGSDRKCKALPTSEEQCAFNAPSQCATGLFCNGENICTPFKTSGQTCDFITPCENNLYCDIDPAETEGYCREKIGLGDSCSSDFVCDSNYCIPGLCDDGGECYEDSDCTGVCVDNGDFCWGDEDCEGACSISGDYCWDDWDCPEIDDVCVHAACVSDCLGDPVCGEMLYYIDYCDMSFDLRFL